jgi:2-polyprenyl-3-methyl-5-hydroxy-6-metoxy-1,4-benzoquinol methylase
MKTPAEIYRFEVDPLSDTAASNVLRFIGNHKRVLEIGAGPGSISRPLVELNGCDVSAIEIDEKSVEILRGFCTSVWRRDLNDPHWADGIPKHSYDGVVIADVLEHLIDPWQMLRRAAEFLCAAGSLVVSIPHASHAAVLGCLLAEDFRYKDWGLLDRTHIRFFGMKNLQEMFEEAGLRIVDYKFVLRHPSETEFADIWRELPARTRAVLEQSSFADVYQVVIQAVPATRDPENVGRSLLERSNASISNLRYVAFYLPQYHPIPENDVWWGKGFTEWANVTAAHPLFPGHHQPHLPGELGFYDLRLPEVRRQQIALAREYGVDAFCFHYYWFGGGKRLLEGPLLDFLADKDADIEFCLCWANENWTRRWDASEHEILMPQMYSGANDLAFIDSLLPFFRDKRYLRVAGAPLLVVYRPQQLPDPRKTTELWRQRCRHAGIGEIHLVAALTHNNELFENFGFDSAVEFPPHNVFPRAKDGLKNHTDMVAAPHPLTGAVLEYADVAKVFLSQDYSTRRVYRGVAPGWDNTARTSRRAVILLESTPDNYERWLEAASHLTIAERNVDDRLVFINAWNEWAEGCHLEPDREYGRAYLEATRRAKSGKSAVMPPLTRHNESNGSTSRSSLEPSPVLNSTLPPSETAEIFKNKDVVSEPKICSHPSPPRIKTRVAIRVASFLVHHPKIYRVARSVYRATLR